jgi:formiminoglutamase
VTSGEEGDLVLLGFPYDIGVERNGGRIGAKEGPTAFRKYYYLNPFESIRLMKRVGTIVNREYGVNLRYAHNTYCKMTPI